MTDAEVAAYLEDMRAYAASANIKAPGWAITREEHDRRVNATGRAVTATPILRHRHSDGHNDVGSWL